MASPFSLFRKYQKNLMVVLAVLAVFAFVIAPSLMQMGDRQPAGGGGITTDVSWNALLGISPVCSTCGPAHRSHHGLRPPLGSSPSTAGSPG
mgnify:CR=1 FL=1